MDFCAYTIEHPFATSVSSHVKIRASAFRKMFLGEDKLDRLQARQIKEKDPSLKAMGKIQGKIKSVLNDLEFAKVHHSERLHIYQNIMHGFS